MVTNATQDGFLNVSGTLTNTQIKNLHATPIQIIAAPGVGKVVQIIQSSGVTNFGGTNAFTAAASQSINCYFGTGANICQLISNSCLTDTTSDYNQTDANINSFISLSNCTNQAVNLYNPVATEISGNAANNNTISYNILYRIITIP